MKKSMKDKVMLVVCLLTFLINQAGAENNSKSRLIDNTQQLSVTKDFNNKHIGFKQQEIKSNDGRFELEFQRAKRQHYRIISEQETGNKLVYQTFGQDTMSFYKPKEGVYLYRLEACVEISVDASCQEVGQPVRVSIDLSDQLLNKSECVNGDLCGGGSHLLPGQWWNPAKEGHGWDLYWVNEPSGINELYVFWYTFRQQTVGSNTKWIPVWLTGKLSQVNEMYSGDLHYCQNINNVIECENNISDAGELTVSFSLDKTHANISWNLDVIKFPGFPSNGTDSIEYYGGLPYGGVHSSNGHFNGIWQNRIDANTMNELFYYSEFMNGDYWSSVLSFYDDVGQPVWVKSEHYLRHVSPGKMTGRTQYVTEGYSPATNKPISYNVLDYQVISGFFTRELKTPKHGYLLGNISLPSSRDGGIIIGNREKAAPIEKLTGQSLLWFEINGDPTITHCSTYVFGACTLNMSWLLDSGAASSVFDHEENSHSILMVETSDTTSDFVYNPVITNSLHHFTLNTGNSSVNEILARSQDIRFSHDVIEPSLTVLSVEEGSDQPGQASAGQFDVQWSWMGIGTTFFELEYRHSSTGNWTFNQRIDVFQSPSQNEKSTGVIDTPVINDGTHAYRIRGCNASVCTPWSEQTGLTLSAPLLTIQDVLNSGQLDLQLAACIVNNYGYDLAATVSTVTALSCDDFSGVLTLNGIKSFAQLTFVSIPGADLIDVSEMAFCGLNSQQSCFSNLSSLNLPNLSSVDLQPLNSNANLQFLYLNDATGVTDLSGLTQLSNLVVLDISNSSVQTVRTEEGGPIMSRLLANGSALNNVEFLESSVLHTLQVFDTDVDNIRLISTSPIKELHYKVNEFNLANLFNLSAVGQSTGLEVLYLAENVFSGTDQFYITPLENLKRFTFGPSTKNLISLANKSLLSIDVEGQFENKLDETGQIIGAFDALSDQFLLEKLRIIGQANEAVSLQPVIEMFTGHPDVASMVVEINVDGLQCDEQETLKDILNTQGIPYDFNPLTCYSDTPVGTGLKAVNGLGFEWLDEDSGTFQLFWSYPESDFNTTSGRPSFFKVEPILTSDNNIPTISVSGWQTQWQSTVINNSDFSGGAYKVTACQTASTCGDVTSTDLLHTPNAALAVPQWDFSASSMHPTVANLISFKDKTQFVLQWDITQNDGVDYFELVEFKNVAKRPADTVTTLDLGNSKKQFVDNNRITLHRTLKGNYVHVTPPGANHYIYKYVVRSCRREEPGTDSVDSCGAWSDVAGVELNYRKTTGADPSLPNPVQNFEWVKINTGGYQLRWQYAQSDFMSTMKKPDYFVYTREGSNTENDHLIAQGWDASGWITRPISGHGTWTVRACKRNKANINSSYDPNPAYIGELCSDAAIVDTTATAASETVENALTPRPGTLSDYEVATISSRGVGGPGELLPGEWWDPSRSGTGWSFYWASGARYPASAENPLSHDLLYGDTYDLIAVWYTYRELDEEDEWRPVWYFAQLKHDATSGPNAFKGQLLYPQGLDHPGHDHSDGSVHESGDQHISVGTVTVDYDVTSAGLNDNEFIKLAVNVNQEGGHFVENLELFLENFTSNGNVSGSCSTVWENQPDNPVDHFSGMWWNTVLGQDGYEVEERFATINQIQKNYESLHVLFYDDRGEPVWGRADRDTSFNGGSCVQSGLEVDGFDVYTVPYGFDPTGPTPAGFWGGGDETPLESITYDASSKVGRKYFGDEYNRGEIWGKLDLSKAFGADRSGILNLGTASAPVGGDGRYFKAANHHGINFFINGSLDPIDNCSIDSTPSTGYDCDLSMSWFTDGYYPTAKPYYKKDNGPMMPLTADQNQVISCLNLVNPTGTFENNEITCSIREAGSYRFFLMKENNNVPVEERWTSMARTRLLRVTENAVPGGQGHFVANSSRSNAHAHPAHDANIGTVGGKASTNGGAAVFNIPIQVPPGRNGMQPGISINYSSNGGDGIMGVGWSLSGLSGIQRCPQTIAQDDNNQAVQFNNNDRLCLDGKRLMQVSAGNYWDSDAEYRTEIDGYTKITRSANGFIAQTKGGITRQYTVSVRPQCGLDRVNCLPTGLQGILGWKLGVESDPSGNEVEYEYETHGSAEVLIKTIHYTGFNGSRGDRSVEFFYSDRAVPAFSLLSGSLTETTKRLDYISTHVPGSDTPVLEYIFDYEQSLATGRDLLRNVDLLAGNNSKAETVFDWQEFSLEFKPKYFNVADIFDANKGIDQAIPEGSKEAKGVDEDAIFTAGLGIYGDINGDGFSELLYSVDDGSDNNSRITYLLSGADLANADQQSINPLALVDHEILANSISPGNQSDVNNDGRVDLIGWGQAEPMVNGAAVNLRIGSWGGASEWPVDGSAVTLTSLMDFNDIPNIQTNLRTITFGNYSTLGPRDAVYTADVNADGLDDIVILERVADNQCQSQPFYANQQLVWYRNNGPDTNHVAVFDDRSLIHCLTRSEDSLDINVGGFIETLYNPDEFNGTDDVDGNGFPDFRIERSAYLPNSGENDLYDGVVLTHQSSSTGELEFTFKSYHSNTASCTQSLGVEPFLSNVYYQYGDFNGDGLQDILYHDEYTEDNANSLTWKVQFNLGHDTKGSTCLYSEPIDTHENLGLAPWNWCSGATCNQTLHQWRPKYASSMRVVDLNYDGRDELLIPHTRYFDSCIIGSWTHVNPIPRGVNEPTEFCGDDMYNAGINGETYGAHDNGIYEYASIDFAAISPNPNQAATVNTMTGIVAPANGLIVQDINSDGLTDLMSLIGIKYNSPLNAPFRSDNAALDARETALLSDIINNANAASPAACIDGDYQTVCSHVARKIYVNIAVQGGNQDPWATKKGPDYLFKATDGLGGQTEWTYQPLSARINSPFGMPLYGVPDRDLGDGYVDEDENNQHIYFNSSMQVVSNMLQSDGLGGFNQTHYGYEEAIYNQVGRGFQGFRKISQEYNPSGLPGAEIRTSSVFHQMFPLADRLESVYTQLASNPYEMGDGAPRLLLSQTDYHWGCFFQGATPAEPYAEACYLDNPLKSVSQAAAMGSAGTNLIYQPLLLSQNSTTYDLNAHKSGGNQLIASGQGSSDFDAYGNVESQTMVTTDHNYLVKTQVTENSYGPFDETAWWVNRLDKSIQIQSSDYASNPPGAPVNPEASKTVSTLYGWDGVVNGHRKPNCQYIQSGVGASGGSCSVGIGFGSKSSFKYDAYGSLRETKVEASQSGTDPFVSRISSVNYSDDGYFAEETTNPMGHASLTLTEPKFGNPYLIRDIKGLFQVIEYDPFGIEVRRYHPAANSATSALAVAFDDTASHYAPRISSVVTRQSDYCDLINSAPAHSSYCMVDSIDGSPQTVQYMDVKGRTLRTISTSMVQNGQENDVFADMSYNARGDLRSESILAFNSPSHHKVSYEYDELGRVLKKAQPSNGTNLYSYYRYQGLKTRVAVSSINYPLNNINAAFTCDQSPGVLEDALCVERVYLSNGQLFSTTDAQNGITRYWQDASGNTVLIKDANGNLTGVKFNNLNQKTNQYDPNMGDWTFSYNGLGEVVNQTDASGNVQKFKYDLMGRMLSREIIPHTSSDLDLILDEWFYDAELNGALHQEKRTVAEGVDQYVSFKRDFMYDSYNGLSTGYITNLQPNLGDVRPQLVVSIENDDYFARPISLSYPSRLQTYINYDENGIVIREGDAANQSNYFRQITEITPQGHIVEALLGNGLEQAYDYSERTWQITDVMAGTSTQANSVFDIGYEYDAFGNLSSQSINNPSTSYSESFEYDKLHRLLESDRTGGDIPVGSELVTYAYDKVGNLMDKSDYGLNYTYGAIQPNAVKSLTLTEAGADQMDYVYDANGNLKAGYKIEAGNSRLHLSVSYDALNKPIHMMRDAASMTFHYGSNNARFLKSDSVGNETIYLDKLYELINGSVEKYYINDYAYWGVGGADAGLHFLHKDRLGSIRAITDANGDLKTDSNRGYDPFGKPRDADTGQDSPAGLLRDDLTTRGFTQHEHLNDVELIHMNGRAYDYNLGRFLSVDPLIQGAANSQGINPYSYVLNNPLAATDPTGYSADCTKTGDSIGNGESSICGVRKKRESGCRSKECRGDSKKTDIYVNKDEKGNVSYSDRPLNMPSNGARDENSAGQTQTQDQNETTGRRPRGYIQESEAEISRANAENLLIHEAKIKKRNERREYERMRSAEERRLSKERKEERYSLLLTDSIDRVPDAITMGGALVACVSTAPACAAALISGAVSADNYFGNINGLDEGAGRTYLVNEITDRGIASRDTAQTSVNFLYGVAGSVSVPGSVVQKGKNATDLTGFFDALSATGSLEGARREMVNEENRD